MNVSAIYDRDFFEMHRTWQPEYTRIADVLSAYLDFTSVLDLGCGCGYLLSRLAEVGKTVLGVDGSRHALLAAPPNLAGKLRLHDLTIPATWGRFTLVICTEVAEHLSPSTSNLLVDTICANAERFVYFTAAVPGQGGHEHINEQPHSFWISKFAARGLYLKHPLTETFRAELRESIRNIWWFPHNSMIFERQPSSL